ncbi:hypothetical protein ACA910_002131 [Epithemia clementina (nom. ined.)]
MNREAEEEGKEAMSQIFAYAEHELSQLPELRARIRRHVHSAIQSFPEQQSQAYMEATQRCPDLVLNETDPLHFLRQSKYQLMEGAQRLSLYWKERKALFGPQRAFLPLKLIGTGALDDNDMTTLRAAFPCMLLPTMWGLQCLFMEPKWRIPGISMENVLRACFYLIATIAEDDRSQVEGIHCLYVVSEPRGPDVDWVFFRRLNYLITKVFPVRLNKIHLLGIPQQRRPSHLSEIMTTATNVLRQYIEDWMQTVQIHMETRPKRVLNELLAAGLTTRGIPLFLGGGWTQRDFSYDWCRERMVWERAKEVPQHAAAAAATEIRPSPSSGFIPPDFPGGTPYQMRGLIAPSGFLNGEGIISAAEAVGGNTSHAAGRAHATGRSTGVLEHVQVGTGAPATAATALERSSTPPDLRESEEEKLAKKRMGNLISSRRKRERHREHLRLLQEESTRLTELNRNFISEQERLEGLIQVAEEVLSEQMPNNTGGQDHNQTSPPPP